MVILNSPIRCATCGKITLFQIEEPGPGAKVTLSFACPGGHLASNAAGGIEVVDMGDVPPGARRVRVRFGPANN